MTGFSKKKKKRSNIESLNAQLKHQPSSAATEMYALFTNMVHLRKWSCTYVY